MFINSLLKKKKYSTFFDHSLFIMIHKIVIQDTVNKNTYSCLFCVKIILILT